MLKHLLSTSFAVCTIFGATAYSQQPADQPAGTAETPPPTEPPAAAETAEDPKSSKSFAEEPIIEEKFSVEKVFDTIWSIPVLYNNKDNPWIQKVAIIGRYQGQVWGINSDFGSNGGWENRRQRIGAKVNFLKTFDIGIQFNLNFNGANTGRFVKDIEDFGLRWRPYDEFNIEGGIYKVPITNEWRTSSNRIITIERSLFINQAIPNKLGGFRASGNVSGFLYGLGLYSATRNEDWGYPTLSGGAVIYAGVGYEFSDDHVLRFDNAVTTDSPGNNATTPYAYNAALSYSGKFLDDRLWLQSDLVMAMGQNDTPNLFGLILLPSYDITDRIQFVMRYQYLVSDHSDGVRLQSRYERRAPDLPTTYGNSYHALYAGLNFYIYKDKMKLMGGMEYSHLELSKGGGYNQITLVGAFRVWF